MKPGTANSKVSFRLSWKAVQVSEGREVRGGEA